MQGETEGGNMNPRDFLLSLQPSAGAPVQRQQQAEHVSSLKQTAHLYYYVLVAGYNLQSVHFWVRRWWYNHSKPQIFKQLIQHPVFEDVVMGIYKKMRGWHMEVQADGGGEEEVSEELKRCRSEDVRACRKSRNEGVATVEAQPPDSSTKFSQWDDTDTMWTTAVLLLLLPPLLISTVRIMCML